MRVNKVSLLMTMLFVMIILQFVKGAEVTIPNEKKLKERAIKIINDIAEGKEQDVLKGLSKKNKIEVDTDIYLTYDQLEKDFKSKGRYYCILFDTNAYLKENANFFIQNKHLNKSSDPDCFYSVRDVFIDALKKNIRFKLNPIVTAKGLEMVNVDISWDGKLPYPKRSSYVLTFDYIDNEWLLISLNIKSCL